jgi:hypothetical protein
MPQAQQTQPMTRADFARFLKSKMPSLAPYDDDAVVNGALERRPDLRSFIVEDTKPAETKQEAPDEGFSASFLKGGGYPPSVAGIPKWGKEIVQPFKEEGAVGGIAKIVESQINSLNEVAELARRKVKNGEKLAGYEYAVYSGLPVIGPVLAKAKQQLEEGNGWGALGTMAGLISVFRLKKPEGFNLLEREAQKVGATTEPLLKRGLEAGDVKIPLTVGEKMKSGTMESVQRAVRPIPFVGKPLEKVVEARRKAILDFAGSVGEEAQKNKEVGQSLYRSLEENSKSFAAAQDQARLLRRQWAAARRKGSTTEAFRLGEDLKNADTVIETVLKREAGPEGLQAWKQAQPIWAKYHALLDVRETIEESLVGLIENRQTMGAPRPQGIKAGSLVESLKDMEKTPFGNVLERAVGSSRANDLLNVASLLDRISRPGVAGYQAVRLAGYLVEIGTLGLAAKFGYGYFSDVVLGLVGTRALTSLMVRKGGSVVVKGFLKAVEDNDIARAETLVKTMGRMARQEVAQTSARTARPTGEPYTPGEAEKLRSNVPVQLQSTPGEDPLGVMLKQLSDQMEPVGMGGELEQELQGQLEKSGAKAREKARTRSAMATFQR